MSRRHPQRILVLLAAVTVIPITVLGGLSVSLLRQQRDAERQRLSDAIETEAGRVANQIETAFEEIETRLAAGEGVRLTPTGLQSSSMPRACG